MFQYSICHSDWSEAIWQLGHNGSDFSTTVTFNAILTICSFMSFIVESVLVVVIKSFLAKKTFKSKYWSFKCEVCGIRLEGNVRWTLISQVGWPLRNYPVWFLHHLWDDFWYRKAQHRWSKRTQLLSYSGFSGQWKWSWLQGWWRGVGGWRAVGEAVAVAVMVVGGCSWLRTAELLGHRCLKVILHFSLSIFPFFTKYI